MPNSTMKAKPTNNRLLTRKAPSRLTGESMPPGEWRRSPRQAMSPTPVTSTTPKKASKSGPMDELENECTDWVTPERVRKVPRMVRLKAATTNDRFQIRNRPRRCCTITECR